MTSNYDSTQDVLRHKERVLYWLLDFVEQLKRRAEIHDNSKLSNPSEKAMFDKWIPEISQYQFGTPEYEQAREGMGEGLALHYKANRHHPEHYEHGVDDMTLIDLVEMVADWMAVAQEKYVSVNIDSAAERFGLSPQMVKIIANTLREEDFWNRVNGVPCVPFCPEQYQEGHIEGVSNV